MISMEPETVFQPILSPRKMPPHAIPNKGIRKVTVSAAPAPMSWISRKKSRNANPVQTIHSTSTAKITCAPGRPDGGARATSGSTITVAAHMLPCAVQNESTVRALFAYVAAMP
jgi:hypothetical protein